MPAGTTPDRISFYGFQPHDEFPTVFMRLIPEIQARRDTDRLGAVIYEMLDCSCLWNMKLRLTAQSRDIFGHARPYNCDDLVDFLICPAGTFDPNERFHYRLIAFLQIGELHAILERTLREPLFQDEKEAWSRLDAQLSRLTGGTLISVYDY